MPSVCESDATVHGAPDGGHGKQQKEAFNHAIARVLTPICSCRQPASRKSQCLSLRWRQRPIGCLLAVHFRLRPGSHAERCWAVRLGKGHIFPFNDAGPTALGLCVIIIARIARQNFPPALLSCAIIILRCGLAVCEEGSRRSASFFASSGVARPQQQRTQIKPPPRSPGQHPHPRVDSGLPLEVDARHPLLLCFCSGLPRFFS